jgi:nucleotide-binding universal stress UspA family protein
MFSTIVVGTDGSATASIAVRMAAQIASQNSATLHLLSVSKMATGVGGGGPASGDPVGGDALLKLAADRMLGEVAREIEGLDVVTHTESGAPATAIVRYADEIGADLIVVGSKGMQGTRRVIGSVPNTVAHKAGCHVMIVKTT